MSTTEIIEDICPYFKTKATNKNFLIVLNIKFHVNIILYKSTCKINPYSGRKRQIEGKHKTKYCTGRKQLTLALLYLHWLKA